MKDVGLPLAAVCEHIVYWVDPVFVKPASSEPDKLHTLDWMKLMARRLWLVSPESSNSIRDVQELRASQKTLILQLVHDLAGEIEKQSDLWKEEVRPISSLSHYISADYVGARLLSAVWRLTTALWLTVRWTTMSGPVMSRGSIARPGTRFCLRS